MAIVLRKRLSAIADGSLAGRAAPIGKRVAGGCERSCLSPSINDNASASMKSQRKIAWKR